ncbi:MAG: DUF1858 domain-containing protein [Prolixibacteraceae bacterium]|jgi:uncharacterized protein (DUF2249 family)|nr:DUF1858 domain-containing protein [Prolixibacteraceae bacterium]
MEQLFITPKTKISELLDAFPELEEVLIEMAPPFKKLKNPVLRKTIARITTIGQAATIANLNVETLVNCLREEAGQSNIEVDNDSNSQFVTKQPEWFSHSNIAEIIDTRDMLNAGEHPVHVVLAAIKKLNEGQILKTIAPFLPAPLIDKASSLGAKHWVNKQSEEFYIIYFSK